jgi:hypothetical protein
MGDSCACGVCRFCDVAFYRRRQKTAALALVDAWVYGELYADMRRIGTVRSSLNPETWSHIPVPIDGRRVRRAGDRDYLRRRIDGDCKQAAAA